MFMDEFYNANNRSWQSYLNVIKSFNYSLFANGLMLVSEIPTVNATAIDLAPKTITLKIDEEKDVSIIPTPFNTTDNIYVDDTYDDYVSTKISDDKRTLTLTGVTATTGVSDVPAYVEIEVGIQSTNIKSKVKVVVTA
jgi:hypothetical protein